MSISYEHYRTFYYVGKYKNLTLAAKFLYSSQPNVSRTIALLEHEYGCRLIERSNRGVTLTPEGEKLHSTIQPAVEQLMRAEQSVATLADMQHGSISIGVSDTALSEIVIPSLNKFQTIHPTIQVRIAYSYCLESVKAVKNSLCDFAIVAMPFPEDSSLICTPIVEVSDIMVCGKAYAHLSERAYTLSELNAYPNICVGRNTIYYPYITGLYAEDGISFQPDIYSTTTAQTILMVKNGLGIGFVPEVLARDELSSGALFRVPLEREFSRRSICLIEKKNTLLNLAASEFKKVVLSMKGK